MALTKLSKENYAWVEAHKKLAIAAANLRAQAGMSERDIFETMRYEVAKEHAPSYRDLRAAFYTYHANHETFSGLRHHRIDPNTNEVVSTETKGETRYRLRLRTRYTDLERARLKRTTVVGYMIQARGHLTREQEREFAQEWRDPDAYLEWEDSQSYDSTPPFRRPPSRFFRNVLRGLYP